MLRHPSLDGYGVRLKKGFVLSPPSGRDEGLVKETSQGNRNFEG
jgi:hypothetical protein